MYGIQRNGSLEEVSEGLETLRKNYLVAARKIMERRTREEGWTSRQRRVQHLPGAFCPPDTPTD